MKKFVLYVFSVLVVTFALLYVLDWIYTYSYTHGTPRNKIAHLMSMENEKVNYVFIGSSRVDNTIDAEIIESTTGKKALNLGIQGADLDDSHLILQLLKGQGITTDLVFIQVDYNFNAQGKSKILKSNLMPFLQHELIDNFIAERDSNYWYLKHIPFYRYLRYDYKLGFREFFNTSIGNKTSNNFQNGYSPIYGSSGEKMEANLPAKIAADNENLNKINSFAKQNNMNVIYFMAPYCSGTTNSDFSEKLQNKLRIFLDFTTIFFKENNYFFNCSHLNDAGAKEFSKIFAQTILEIDE